MAFDLKGFYSKIYRTYDLVNRLFTLGMDKKWRKAAARKCHEQQPNEILDLCCGTGDLTLSLVQQAPSAKINITGFDFNPDMLAIAKTKANHKIDNKARFIEGDAGNMPFDEKRFDAITIGFGFRNLTFENPNQDKHLKEIFRVLKTGGSLLILESGVPENPIIWFFYKLYLYLFLIPIGTLLSGNFKAYWYLAHSSSKFYSIEEISALLEKAGFKNIEARKFFMGAANLIVARK